MLFLTPNQQCQSTEDKKATNYNETVIVNHMCYQTALVLMTLSDLEGQVQMSETFVTPTASNI